MAVAAGQRHHQGGEVLGQRVAQRVGFGEQHLRHARHGGGRLGRGAAALPGHQHVDVAADARGRGEGVEDRRLEAGVVVFGDDENGHGQITFASFLSLSTSSATLLTALPAPRLAGSATLRVCTRGVMSTPSDSGVTMSSGFFLAFMMLGRVT